MRKTFLTCLALTASAFSPATAQPQQPDGPVDASTRSAVVAELGDKLRRTYVFPDVAERTAQTLAAKADNNGYDGFDTAQEFAAALHEDLRRIGNDGHFSVRYAPDFNPPMAPSDRAAPSAETLEQMRAQHGQMAYGINRVLRLEGNIGYMDVRGFGMPEFTAPAYEGALRLLSGSDAVIIDLRSNGGGDPASVALMMSHFFARGDERHINSIYNRPSDTTREYWTNPTVETRYTGPVYLVTSSRTFSGGEEFAYDMQTQKRGTLFGETTGGGANPGETVKLGNGFVAFIPDGRAINPITGTNWEHVGVKPDVEVAAADALDAAYSAALKEAMERETIEGRKAAYADLIARHARGEVQLPAWRSPRR